jgi:hypothetical protein
MAGQQTSAFAPTRIWVNPGGAWTLLPSRGRCQSHCLAHIAGHPSASRSERA